MGERLIIGFDSALEFWRRARAAAPSAPDLEPAGHVFGAQRLSVPERAARVCEGYGLEAPLTLVAVGRGRRYACRGVSFLTWSGPLPDALLFGLGDDVFVCRMPLALSQLSRSYDEIGLAEVAYEMAGTYGLAPWAHDDLVKDVRPLTDVSELVSYAQAARALGTYGSSKVLAALTLVVPNSNSPRETGLGIYMMQSRARGGARLGGFRMNEPLELPSQLQEFLGQRVIKPDFLWPNGTVMEYDSDDWHLSPRKKAADERKPAVQPARRRGKDEPVVVDLHASELLETTAGLSAADILNHQLDVFRKTMDEYKNRHGVKLVFIHGKGEGVLRHAIVHELNYRYKNCPYQDASFQEYGYGATQVTIK